MNTIKKDLEYVKRIITKSEFAYDAQLLLIYFYFFVVVAIKRKILFYSKRNFLHSIN